MKFFLKNAVYILVCCILLPGCGGGQQQKESLMYESSLSKRFKDMSFDEALYAYDYYKKLGDLKHTSKALERLLNTSVDHDIRGVYLLERADIEMAYGDYARAQKLYYEYRTLYPGAVGIESVAYRELIAMCRQMWPIQWDQEKTQSALDLIKYIREEMSASSEQEAQIEKVEQYCHRQNVLKEIEVLRFYTKKFIYAQRPETLDAAQKRLAYIQEEIVPKITDAGVREDIAEESAVLTRIKDLDAETDKELTNTNRFGLICASVDRIDAIMADVQWGLSYE